MTIEMIPLNQLTPSQANVRKTGALSGIEELAASIEAHGLLQNLTVRAAPKGKFEVVAGGRRLAALTILRRQKKLVKDFPVPCHVIGDVDAGEVSLAENVVRLAMHPADQFEAFKALADQGMGLEDIAARFGVSVAVVRQRLKLASVSPVLVEVYREGDMTLDQLMAFTVSDDPAAQEAAWFACPAFRRDPRSIRATLTEAQVEADDRRVRFVGLDTYRAAGGGINRDLFQPEHEGYLTDPALLDRLVVEKLEAAAADIRADGWAWVKIMPMRDHAALSDYARLRPTRQALDEEQFGRVKDLTAEYDALVSTYGEEPDDEDIAATMQNLWDEIDSIEATAFAWSAEDIARSGVILTLDYDGALLVECGLVPTAEMRRPTVGADVLSEGESHTKPSGLSAALVQSLTAERTAALRAMLMDDTHVALASLCHALALALFYPIGTPDRTSLHIRLDSRDLADSAEAFSDSPAGTLLAERHAAWDERMPDDADDLFGWLLVQDVTTITALLAYCAAQSVNAVRCKADWPDNPRLVHADALAATLNLDMRDWWQPTRANYLGRVSKSMALAAVREGVSAQAAENLALLKKDKLTEAAERRLAGTGWLPALLRQPEVVGEVESEDDMRQAA